MRIKYHYFSLVFIVLSSFIFLASKPVTDIQDNSSSAISANLVYGDYSKFTFIVKNTSNNPAKVEEIVVGSLDKSYKLSFEVFDIDQQCRYKRIPKKSEARLVVNFVDSKNKKVDCPESIEKVSIKMKIGDDAILLSSYRILICDNESDITSYAKK